MYVLSDSTSKLMRVVIAIGGNALLKRGQKLEARYQLQNIQQAIKGIASIAKQHEVVLCHGNGPQIGLLALEADAYQDVAPYPLDILGAETQGMIGYLLQRELKNHLPNFEIVTLLNQTRVEPKDPAFERPTKFIGPVYTKQQVEKLQKSQTWCFHQDGADYRRVVPSPEPHEIIEQHTIARLLSPSTLVICGGGGGIPVYRHNGRLCGIEAVVDKDKTAALLAERLHADALMILTDVDAVFEHWGTEQARALRQVSVAQLSEMVFPPGSMGPKIDAACRFVSATKQPAMIGHLADAEALLMRQAGTHIEG